MNTQKRRSVQSAKAKRLINVHELARGMKPGEVKKIGKNTYVIPMFLVEQSEPIKKNGKTKPKKKSA